jgi:hypothetical protein
MREVLLATATVVAALALSAGTASAGGTGALNMLKAEAMWPVMDNHTNVNGDNGMFCAVHMSTGGAAGFCLPHH